MKKPLGVLVLLMVAVVLVLLFWRRPIQPPAGTEPPQATVQSTNAPATASSSSVSSTPPPTTSVNQPGIVTGKVETPEQAKQEIESANLPIDFYGLVIDQNSNPIPGVEIKSGVRHWVMPDPTTELAGSTNILLTATTGVDGRFELSGATGDVFGILLRKDGYILSPKTPGGFAAGTSSYNTPVIFRMWRKGPEEQLISGRHVFGIDSGKIYTLNLITGKKIEGEAEGDLLVTITRPPNAKPRDKFPWSFSIQAIQGGFAQPDPNDEFMYIAPASGYQPTIAVQFDTNDLDWIGVVNKQFFFCSRNGQVYGRGDVEVRSIYNANSAIRISYTLNATGSRDLQP
jgi:hypothetical protein